MSDVEWQSPAFAPYAPLRPAAGADWRETLNRLAAERRVLNASGLPIQFPEPDKASGIAAYEAHIASTGSVPTRANRHDFFNALVWIAFPRTKARLNALQADVITRDGIQPQRGTLRDATTLFDENGLLLVTDRSDVIEALQRRDWQELFVEARSAWARQARAIVFGHALLDKLTRPYKTLTAHAISIPLAAATAIDALDTWLAATLDERFSKRRLSPLPVMGIPGWSAANEDPRFYDDTAVFRPPSSARF